MASYIKYLFKTVRKFFGEAVVVTQEVDDIISSPFGMEISERVPIQMSATAHDLFYLKTKQNRMGHILSY